MEKRIFTWAMAAALCDAGTHTSYSDDHNSTPVTNPPG